MWEKKNNYKADATYKAMLEIWLHNKQVYLSGGENANKKKTNKQSKNPNCQKQVRYLVTIIRFQVRYLS